MTVIKPIFNDLNDDSQIVGQFIEVLSNKTTEQAIYEKFKEIYDQKFLQLHLFFSLNLSSASNSSLSQKQ